MYGSVCAVSSDHVNPGQTVAILVDSSVLPKSFPSILEQGVEKGDLAESIVNVI